jgi:hypothetical protein
MITLELQKSMDELAKGIGNDRLYGEYLATFAKSQDQCRSVDPAV